MKKKKPVQIISQSLLQKLFPLSHQIQQTQIEVLPKAIALAGKRSVSKVIKFKTPLTIDLLGKDYESSSHFVVDRKSGTLTVHRFSTALVIKQLTRDSEQTEFEQISRFLNADNNGHVDRVTNSQILSIKHCFGKTSCKLIWNLGKSLCLEKRR